MVLTYDVHDHIATITRNRPEIMNALNRELYGRLEQAFRHALDQSRNHAICSDHVPAPVDRQRRERLVRAKQALDGRAHMRHRRMVESALDERRRIAGGQQQRVALAQGDVQPIGQMQHHLAARR